MLMQFLAKVWFCTRSKANDPNDSYSWLVQFKISITNRNLKGLTWGLSGELDCEITLKARDLTFIKTALYLT